MAFFFCNWKYNQSLFHIYILEKESVNRGVITLSSPYPPFSKG
jgi:hypothetical protein